MDSPLSFFPLLSMPFSPLRATATALYGLSLLSSAYAFNPTFPYGREKVRGVNLGGWLVLEVRRLALHECFPSLTTRLAVDHAIVVR